MACVLRKSQARLQGTTRKGMSVGASGTEPSKKTARASGVIYRATHFNLVLNEIPEDTSIVRRTAPSPSRLEALSIAQIKQSLFSTRSRKEVPDPQQSHPRGTPVAASF
jgi:hypothetical protein